VPAQLLAMERTPGAWLSARDRVKDGAKRQTKQMVAGATIVAEKLERAMFAPEVVDSEAHSRPVWNKFEGCVREQSWRWDGGSRCAGARVPLLAAIGFAGGIPLAQRSARYDTLVASMLFVLGIAVNRRRRLALAAERGHRVVAQDLKSG
jgi:hypothetical protein